MDHTSSSSSSFTTTHYLISFLSTALLVMGLIYWVSGCQSVDHSNNKNKAVQEAPQHEGHH